MKTPTQEKSSVTTKTQKKIKEAKNGQHETLVEKKVKEDDPDSKPGPGQVTVKTHKKTIYATHC